MYYNMEDFVILRKQSQKVDFDNSVSILEKSAAFNGVELLFNDKMETSCSRLGQKQFRANDNQMLLS